MRMRHIVQGSASTVSGIRAIVWYLVSTLLVIIATTTCKGNSGELIQIMNGKKEVGNFCFIQAQFYTHFNWLLSTI